MTEPTRQPTMDDVLRDGEQVRRRMLRLTGQRFLADTVLPFQGRPEPVRRTRRQRLETWLSGWSAAIRERLALWLAPWLDRDEL